MEVVTCGQCSKEFKDKKDVSEEQRKACPSCGSKSRHIGTPEFSSEVKLHSEIRIKGKRKGKTKKFIEMILGDSFSTFFKSG